MTTENDNDLIPLPEAAQLADVSVRTIRRWGEAGRLTLQKGPQPIGGGPPPTLASRAELLTLLGLQPTVDAQGHSEASKATPGRQPTPLEDSDGRGEPQTDASRHHQAPADDTTRHASTHVDTESRHPTPPDDDIGHTSTLSDDSTGQRRTVSDLLRQLDERQQAYRNLSTAYRELELELVASEARLEAMRETMQAMDVHRAIGTLVEDIQERATRQAEVTALQVRASERVRGVEMEADRLHQLAELAESGREREAKLYEAIIETLRGQVATQEDTLKAMRGEVSRLSEHIATQQHQLDAQAHELVSMRQAAERQQQQEALLRMQAATATQQRDVLAGVLGELEGAGLWRRLTWSPPPLEIATSSAGGGVVDVGEGDVEP